MPLSNGPVAAAPTASDAKNWPHRTQHGGLSLADDAVPADTAGDRWTKGCPAQRGSKGDLMLPSAVMRLVIPETAATARSRHRPGRPGAVSASARLAVDWGALRGGGPAVGTGTRTPRAVSHAAGSAWPPVSAPAFVEWLQGLEPGWVTGLGLPRTAELRALGNGVVPQQAAHAVALLLTDLAGLLR